MKSLTPPAISKQAEDAEMQQLAYEAAAAIEAADKATKNTLERYKEAGEALAKAKKKCGHGKWLPWLKTHGIDLWKAARAIRVSSNWAKLGTAPNLKEALKTLADPGEETEKAKPVEVAPLCRRCQNVGPAKDCKACEEAEAEWKSQKKGKSKPDEEAADEPADREPGDDTEHEEQAKVEEKAQPKPGMPKYEIKGADKGVSILTLEVDKFGNAFGVKEKPEVDKMRKRIADWHDDFKALVEKHLKAKSPEATC